MSAHIYQNGVIREIWNDTDRIYVAYDEGGSPTLTRPYTAEENAIADAEAQAGQIESNRRAIEAALADALAELQTIVDATNATINAGPAPYIKILARAARRLIRLVIRRFEGTS